MLDPESIFPEPPEGQQPARSSSPAGPRELWQTTRACQWRSPDGLVIMYDQGDHELFPAGIQLPPYWRKVADNPPGYDRIPVGKGRLRAGVIAEWETDTFGAQRQTGFRRLGLGDELRFRAAIRRERFEARYARPLDLD